MANRVYTTLEFDKILARLADHALSDGAKTRCEDLSPILNLDLLAVAQRETQDARALIEALGNPPLPYMAGLEDGVRLATQGGLLSAEALAGVATFCGSCSRMSGYLKKGEIARVELSLNGRAFMPLDDLRLEIEGAVRGDEVMDSASPRLRDIRRSITVASDNVKLKLSRMLQSHKDWFSEGFVVTRGGRQTLPVKASQRNNVPGAVIDRSATGGTLFIEPTAVRQAQEELQLLQLDEENEVRRVLYALSALVADCEGAIAANAHLCERLDFVFAKAKLSLAMDAVRPEITEERGIRIVKGRHPLLSLERAVPLDFAMGGDVRGVIITGPNTGGKTVALKTIGLLSLMAQSGLHVPAGDGTRLCPFNQVLVDIGDGQSIAENLSTFSSHMVQVLEVLRSATKDSLVLLDELGSGTDPAEGMGLAVAVLDALAQRGCLMVATTHYPEVKEFARLTPGMLNARMAFDSETLAPLYSMILGEAGESCALSIAKRLGFTDALLDRAKRAAYDGELAGGGLVEAKPQVAAPRISAYEKAKQAPARAQSFHRGDSVRVFPERSIGIVYKETDERGMIGVQTQGRKAMVQHKRLKLIAPASEMYPEDYDFSIVFDTVTNRKARHVMEKRHDESAVAVYEE